MESSRFLKILWTINGVILLIIFILIAFKLVQDQFNRFSYKEPKVIVGKELEEAKKEGLVLQGLEFSAPNRIYNSEVFILPVKLKTYEQPKSLDFDSRSKLKVGRDESEVVNIIFLDKDMQPISTLLNRKALIKSYEYPMRSSFEREPEKIVQKNILYEIAFEDSNKDGNIDNDDNSDLFITDLTGKDFTQVTKGVDVLNYTFLDSTRILIRYHQRTDEPEEHKKDYLSLYSITDKTLKDLTALHNTLDEIEKQLTQ